MQNNDIKICVLGSANVDYFVYVHHIPVPGQTIQATKYMLANGGKGANQAVAVARLSGKANFVGQVGKDDQMKRLKAEMGDSGVQLNWTEHNEIGTGKAFIYVEEGTGENSIVIVGGANMYYPGAQSLPESYRVQIDRCGYLLLQKQVPMAIDLQAAKYAKSKGKIVILDCGGRDDEIPEELIDNLDYISPNQTELLRINPEIKEQSIVADIRQKIIKKHNNLKVLLKLGSRGSAIVTSELHVECPIVTHLNPKVSHQYTIVDTVGAGDCFTGAFCVKHSELDWSNKQNHSANYKQAMMFGNSAAFLCITKKGAMPSMPSRKEVDAFVQAFGLL